MAMPAQTPPNSVATEGITSPSGTFGEVRPPSIAAVIKAIKALIFRRMMSRGNDRNRDQQHYERMKFHTGRAMLAECPAPIATPAAGLQSRTALRTFSAWALRKSLSFRLSAASESARMATAFNAAFFAPARADGERSDGNPPGICTGREQRIQAVENAGHGHSENGQGRYAPRRPRPDAPRRPPPQ